MTTTPTARQQFATDLTTYIKAGDGVRDAADRALADWWQRERNIKAMAEVTGYSRTTVMAALGRRGINVPGERNVMRERLAAIQAVVESVDGVYPLDYNLTVRQGEVHLALVEPDGKTSALRTAHAIHDALRAQGMGLYAGGRPDLGEALAWGHEVEVTGDWTK